MCRISLAVPGRLTDSSCGGGGDVTVLMSCIKGFLEASGWSLYDAGLDRVFRYPRNGTSIDRGSISPRLLYVI